jgi:diacylglycerol kinase (ATP)
MVTKFFDSRIVVNGHLTHNTSWQSIRKKIQVHLYSNQIQPVLYIWEPLIFLTFWSTNEKPGVFAIYTGIIAKGNSSVKPGLTGITRIMAASKNSLSGIRDAWRYESAFRQNSILSIVLLILSFQLAQTVVEWLILIMPLFLLAIVELLNSAIENTVDRIGPERHILSGRAKDMGSAATMFCLIMIATVWLSMTWSRYFA